MNSTPTHYLRVEGVNLDSFVFDTRDLSTVRGGSLMLLDAVRTAESALGSASVKPLSTGASAGLFEVTTDDPKKLAATVRDHLTGEYPHATFVVDTVPVSSDPEDFRKDVESLLAANRLRQMEASSLAIPPANNGGTMAEPACALDGVRPAVNDDEHGAPNRGSNKNAFICEPVHARRKEGRKAKQDFYEKITESNDLPDFAGDFETIAKDARAPVPEALVGKLAVFYADGNSFGSIQAKHCTTPEKQRAWDEFIRGKRAAFLKKFLQDEIIAHSDVWQTNGTARFETLLWGGDELMFVMPARLGWRFARLFFEYFEGMNLKDAGESLSDKVLTHAAALVFCQHHAPIERIKRLAAGQMTDFVKDTSRDRDALAVLALESFDHLGQSYEHAMADRYHGAVLLSDMLLAGRDGTTLPQALMGIAEAIRHLRSGESEFARSQLRARVTTILAAARQAADRGECPAEAAKKMAAFNDVLSESFKNASEEDKKHLKSLEKIFPTATSLWLQLEELLDYARS